jgi:sigma-54 specific flagellar transcriptional regulator A
MRMSSAEIVGAETGRAPWRQARQSAIVGSSAPTQALVSLIDTLASSTATVLITGESGTGKELVARALHDRAPRREGQFVPINCGAVPKELLESELFGHRKGSFTGALSDRIGRFELAHGGTLFLDEVGDLPADMQVKLLRVLQERCIVPLGSNREIGIDVRIVAATHRNMEEEVRAGRFREDLYYRLNVLPVHVAALRERPQDVRDLLHFYSARHRGPDGSMVCYKPDLLKALMRYEWPGNVRELCNLVDRFATFFPGGTIGLGDIADWLLPSGLVRLKQAAAEEPAEAGPIECVSATAAEPEVAVGPVAMNPATHASSDDAPNGCAQAGSGLPSSCPDADLRAMEALLCLAQSIDRTEPVTGHPVEESGPVTVEPLRPEGISLKRRMHEIERSYIMQALERTSWNVSQTARLLSLQRTTLIEKINRFGLTRHRGAVPGGQDAFADPAGEGG